jgi:hypothetical protein
VIPQPKESLIAGPRGRRLCWAVLDRLDGSPGLSPFSMWHFRQDPRGLSKTLESSLSIDLHRLAVLGNDEWLLNCVAESVNAARYWQDPDELDLALADPRFTDPLGRVAEAIAASPTTSWWSSGVDPENQIYLHWPDDGELIPRLAGADVILRNWREAVTAHGSWWWSVPLWLRLRGAEPYESQRPKVAVTTRSLPYLGAVGLLLEEDSSGTPETQCWSVRSRHLPRTFEIDSASDWLELVDLFGIDVTRSVGDAWRFATGLEGPWLLPDWSSVAEDYDVVHLTINGYLTVSGRPLSLDSNHATFLAGWSPDRSYWLTDVLELSGLAVPWEFDRQRWRRVQR